MQKKLHVLGSLNVDMTARVGRLPAPGETVQGGDISVLLGGKGANQAVAAARVGADVCMLGAIGNQSFGLDLRALMVGYGVDMTGVETLSGTSGAALIAVDAAGENAITVSPGTNGRLAEIEITTPPKDAILLAQMETPPEITRDWFQEGRMLGCRTILNAAPALSMPDGLLAATDILMVNETELAHYGEIPIAPDDPIDEIAAIAGRLKRSATQIIIVTLGQRGALAIGAGDAIHIPARKTTVRDTTGAGDCFSGTLAAGIAEGKTLTDAMTLASVAASISVTRDGAAPSMPDRAEVDLLTGR